MKFYFAKPDRAAIDRFLAAKREAGFTYGDVGASRFGPDGNLASHVAGQYRILHHRHCLGRGEETFLRVRAAFGRWRMYQLSWLDVCWPETPLVEGEVVATLGQVMGTWWINVNRVIYTVEEDGPVARFGFAYGTLDGSVLSGEERVLVEWNRRDDTVYYDLFSFSRANRWIARAMTFYLWFLQERFARESARAMERIALGR
ncbi:MAG: DUF1990 domain-containing protein [Magnetococcales bacterium]|nr:DUF1990 domain-containing protein [Magnetococcales bacterium]